MTDTSHRNAFFVHLAVYTVLNAILFAINASQQVEPGAVREWWAIYPLAGWGIGLAAHAFGLWAESHARQGQLLADADVRGVAVHLVIYLAVNAFLIWINLSGSPDTFWSIWPVLGWGLGLAGHAWLAFRAVERRTLERYATEQRILTEMQLEKQAAAIAAVVAEPEEKKTPAKRRSKAAAKRAKKPASRRGTADRKLASKSSPTPKKHKALAKTTARSRQRKTKKVDRTIPS